MRPRLSPTTSSDSTSSSPSTLSSSSPSSDHGQSRCSKFLIPETFDLINTSSENIARLECNRRASSWDEYLYDTALEKWSCEQDRLEMRATLLREMKSYYGNQKWRNVESVEDIELYCDDESKKVFLDMLVLYGDASKRRCRYVDRQSNEVTKCAFRRRRLNAVDERPGLMAILRRWGDKMSDDLGRLTIR